jgi:hypothetical protein
VVDEKPGVRFARQYEHIVIDTPARPDPDELKDHCPRRRNPDIALRKYVRTAFESRIYTFSDASFLESAEQSALLVKWRDFYHHLLQTLSELQLKEIAQSLPDKNPQTVLLRPIIESTWEAIANHDNWQPFSELLSKIQNKQ